ncbi:MAG: porin family protein [Cryomorphaceae bacterium]
MSEQNQIDDLFREKLNGVQAGGYSDAAWGNAKALLDSHFRFLFFKKLLLFTLPVAALLGIVWFSLPGDMDKHTVSPIRSEVAISDSVQAHGKPNIPSWNIFDRSLGETPWKATSEEHDLVNAPSTPVEKLSYAPSSPDGAIEGPNSDQPSNASVRAFASNSSEALKKSPGGMLPSENTIQPEVGATQPEALVVTTPSAHRPSSAENRMESTTRPVRALLDEMPTFALGSLGAGEGPSILSRQNLKKEALENNAPVFELSAGIGLLAGQDLDNPMQRMIKGTVLSLQGRYSFNERFFASSGVIYNQREAIIGGFSVITQSQKLRSRSMGYLDIPLMVGYRFGARHSISFGMAFSPLVRMKAEDVSQIIYETETVVIDNNGPRSGFASFDVAGLLGYRFQVSSRWFVDAQLRYGLFDLTDDAFFDKEEKHHNHQLRFGLSYRFFNR